MYKIGDTVIYGATGPCKITDITTLNGMRGADRNRKYYVLEPLFQNGKIYSPAEDGKTYMRPVISREEARRVIDRIPEVNAEAYVNTNLQLLTEHYKEMINTHDCDDLVELSMSIYAKKRCAEQQKRKFGQIDDAYLKQAEDLLFGELAVALDIPKDEVPNLIAQRVKDAKKEEAQEQQ